MDTSRKWKRVDDRIECGSGLPVEERNEKGQIELGMLRSKKKWQQEIQDKMTELIKIIGAKRARNYRLEKFYILLNLIYFSGLDGASELRQSNSSTE